MAEETGKKTTARWPEGKADALLSDEQLETAVGGSLAKGQAGRGDDEPRLKVDDADQKLILPANVQVTNLKVTISMADIE